ncbi:MAG: C39 family peptidase [Chloroflexota bacterium]
MDKVQLKSQHDLVYNDQPTEYGCVPTSVSMITDYWHNNDANSPTKTPQELLDLNAAQKEFDAKGMSPTDIHDELSRMGYVAEDHTNTNFDQLRDAVKESPVLAIVKLNLKEAGANHAVVVTNISEKGDVAINDPWTGQARTYSQQQFTKSWGANFGKDAPTNSYVTINPK